MSLFGKWTPGIIRGGKPSAGKGAPGAQPPNLQHPSLLQPMNLIQVPDISRKLVTRYGLREKSPTPTLAAEVVPVVLVDDLVGESDLIRPRIRPVSGTIQTTTAANQCQLGLYNPPGSRVIIHLYYLWLGVTSGNILWEIRFTGTPIFGLTGTAGFRNGLMPNQGPAGNMIGAISAVSPGGVVEAHVRAGASTIQILPFDCVLDEGQAIILRQPAITTATQEVNMIWSEEDK